jgi:hypothetical protein
MITLATKLFELLGTITVNNSDANTKIDDTSGKVNDMHGKFTDGMKKAATWGVAITAAVAGAAAAAVKGIKDIVNSTVQSGDEIDKASQRMGLSRQSYQEWAYILGQCGAEIGNMEIGMKTLITQMDASADPNSESAKMFKQLGVSVRNADGSLRSIDEVFLETILALTSMEDGTEKARIANVLFGRSGQDLMPVINGTAEEIVGLKERSHELGLIMSDEAVDAAVLLGDTMDDTKKAYGTFGRLIGESVMPSIQGLFDYLLLEYPKIKDGFTKDFLPSITQAVGGFVDIIKWIIDPDGGIDLDAAMDNLVGGFVGIIDKLAEKAPDFVAGLIKLFKALAEHAPELVAALTPLIVEIGKALVVGIITNLPDIITAAIATIDEAGRALLEAMGFGWMFATINENGAEYLSNVKLADHMTAPQKLAGRYAGWTDDQKEAAEHYIWASHGGHSTTEEIEALKNLGIDGDALETFQAEVSEALASGDYEVGVEDAWFEPQVASNLQTQLDQLALTTDVTAYAHYVSPGVLPEEDGEFATGLDFVPRDNFIARLHQGEAVLTRQEASQWRNGMGDTSRLESMMGNLVSLMQQMVANQGNGQAIVLDSGVLVGQIGGKMDRHLGRIVAQKARG